MTRKDPPPPTALASAALLLFCVVGIYSAYLTQGVVSEHLQLKKYGAGAERLGNLEALNGAQSLCCFVWAWIILQIMIATGSIKAGETALWHEYWKAGITNSIGPALGMVALKNITYSAQVLVSPAQRQERNISLGAMFHATGHPRPTAAMRMPRGMEHVVAPQHHTSPPLAPC